MKGRRFVSMDTTTMFLMPARRTAITVRSGLAAECLLAPVRGTAMAVTGADEAITDAGGTDAGFTGTRGMPAEATDAKVTRVAAIAAATTVAGMGEGQPGGGG